VEEFLQNNYLKFFEDRLLSIIGVTAVEGDIGLEEVELPVMENLHINKKNKHINS